MDSKDSISFLCSVCRHRSLCLLWKKTVSSDRREESTEATGLLCLCCLTMAASKARGCLCFPVRRMNTCDSEFLRIPWFIYYVVTVTFEYSGLSLDDRTMHGTAQFFTSFQTQRHLIGRVFIHNMEAVSFYHYGHRSGW